MPRPYQLAVVGLGKIAVDQHLPAIAATPGLALAATVDPNPASGLAPTFASLDALLASGIALDALVVCTPPQARAAIARRALDARLSVLLEKPPATTLEDVEDLRARADLVRRSLFAAWHSRFAPMVPEARAFLAGREVSGGRIDWREDVRRWHPGQHWLWQAGGLGVFDPGINALSILTALLPTVPTVAAATLDVPANAQTPIAAQFTLDLGTGPGAGRVEVALDFLQEGPQAWDIRLETRCGHRLHLADGGATLSLDDAPARRAPSAEYPALYAHFAALLDARASDADPAPLALAADALARGTVRTVAPFVE
jgi:D-galactose 1-dehydrogenase